MRIGSGEGFWGPIVWVILALGILAMGFAVWLQGRRTYKRGTEQEEPFLSGEKLSKGGGAVAGIHLYWGFAEALRPLLSRLVAFHSGFVGDYVGWLLVVLVVSLLVVMLS
jgi:hypothetical protein